MANLIKVNFFRKNLDSSRVLIYAACRDVFPHNNLILKINLRACLHEGGGPQVSEVTCGGLPHLTCKRDHIKMRDYMDRRVTSPIWGTPPPCK